MRYLSLKEVIELHRLLLERTGGLAGVRDLGLLESAVAQPLMSFGGQDLYPTVAEKAAALGFSLIKNHPFNDGNKRIGHAALETFLVLNGYEIASPVDEQERTVMGLAAGEMGRADFTDWLRAHIIERRA
jgi:death on curing protein